MLSGSVSAAAASSLRAPCRFRSASVRFSSDGPSAARIDRTSKRKRSVGLVLGGRSVMLLCVPRRACPGLTREGGRRQSVSSLSTEVSRSHVAIPTTTSRTCSTSTNSAGVQFSRQRRTAAVTTTVLRGSHSLAGATHGGPERYGHSGVLRRQQCRSGTLERPP